MSHKANVLVRVQYFVSSCIKLNCVLFLCLNARVCTVLFVAFFVLLNFFSQMIRFLTPLHFWQLMQCLHNAVESVFIPLTCTFIKYNLIDFRYVMFVLNLNTMRVEDKKMVHNEW